MTVPVVHHFRTALPGDVAVIAAMLTAAAVHDPLTRWLLPTDVTPRDRYHHLHPLLTADITHAVEHGGVDVLADVTGVAVWHHHTHPNTALPPRHRFGPDAGRAAVRYAQLQTTLDSYRSAAPHHWLTYLWIHPSQRGLGVGRQLLDHRHQIADEEGIPVDAVVTTTGLRDYLTACGYHPDLPLHLPAGPALWPLRRTGRPLRTHPAPAG
ncbi:GNAT family N-acetyltransferase [Micromonospora fluostatini]|uniref:GNAT family N-acetyltransferase n=1 Tax=Micromonospora sp. JCM 30529 TaxID=3421643 RepID=UPI003D184870